MEKPKKYIAVPKSLTSSQSVPHQVSSSHESVLLHIWDHTFSHQCSNGHINSLYTPFRRMHFSPLELIMDYGLSTKFLLSMNNSLNYKHNPETHLTANIKYCTQQAVLLCLLEGTEEDTFSHISLYGCKQTGKASFNKRPYHIPQRSSS